MTLKNPLDMHLHLRDSSILNEVAPFSARDFRAAVIMPNLIPPIENILQEELSPNIRVMPV